MRERILLSKSEFAAAIGISSSRISQMIAAGQIDASALVGEGRFARIDVDLARSQIRARRHPGQALGNGVKTKLDGPLPAWVAGHSGGLAGGAAEPDSVTDQIQRERLEDIRRRNRLGATAEREALSQLVTREDMLRELRQVEGQLGALFCDDILPAAAAEVARAYGLDRDAVWAVVKPLIDAKRLQTHRAPN